MRTSRRNRVHHRRRDDRALRKRNWSKERADRRQVSEQYAGAFRACHRRCPAVRSCGRLRRDDGQGKENRTVDDYVTADLSRDVLSELRIIFAHSAVRSFFNRRVCKAIAELTEKGLHLLWINRKRGH